MGDINIILLTLLDYCSLHCWTGELFYGTAINSTVHELWTDDRDSAYNYDNSVFPEDNVSHKYTFLTEPSWMDQDVDQIYYAEIVSRNQSIVDAGDVTDSSNTHDSNFIKSNVTDKSNNLDEKNIDVVKITETSNMAKF